jgi:hypothetical protein
MDLEIITTAPDFNFKTISLADPQPLHGQPGFYFTPLHVGEEKKALCLQLPECLTKQGLVAVKNGNYLDLMFERSSNEELMRWIEQLEYTCQDRIDTKKDLWFQTELTRDDIETMMTQVTRLYQSGKYMLMRVFVETVKAGNKCIAYDENEIGFDLELLEPNKPVVPLIMIEGVKFSSRSFEISLKLTQVMVIGKCEKKSTCLIKRKTGGALEKNLESVSESVEESVKEITQEALVLAKPALIQEPSLVEPMLVSAPALVSAPELISEPALVSAPALVPEPALVSAPAIVHRKPMLVPPTIVKDGIEEITIDYDSTEPESINLKKPNDVYYEIYKKAREKAKHCRIAAIEAYLEAKQIKTKYMLFDEDDDSDDLSDDLSDELSEDDINEE